MSLLVIIIGLVCAYKAAQKGLVLLPLMIVSLLVGFEVDSNPWDWFLGYALVVGVALSFWPEPKSEPAETETTVEPEETSPQKPNNPKRRPKSRPAYLRVIK